MAKKSSETSGKCSVFDLVSKVDCSVEILSDARTAVIADYIDSGNYMLNAAMTGSIFKGAPTGRVLTLTGEPGTGKTFIALSLCRNAQKKGYTPIYIDSEGAIDEEFVKRMGCDTHNFVIKQASTVGEVSTFIANITKDLLAMKAEDRPKIIMVLDSVGNLASDKEVEDALAGNGKAEMRRAKDIKAMFRVNMTNISKLQIPFVVCTHQYYSQDFISKTIVGGGCLVPGSKIITKDGVKNIEDVEECDSVLSSDSTYREVLKTFTFEKPTIKFTFDDGSEIECSEDHKFLVERDGSKVWVKASELKENDEILKLE